MAPTSVVIAPSIYAIAITDRRHFIHSAATPSPTSCIPACNPHNANLWLCSSGSALFGSGIVLETPQSSRKKGGTEEQPVADPSCSLNGRIGEGEASTSGYVEKPWVRIRNRRTHPSQNVWKVRAERDPSSSGESGEDLSVQVTVEENKRLLALQKELLEQVTERKKLLNSLTQDFGTSNEQSGSSEAEKLEKDGSPIGLQEPSPPKRAPGIGPWPPQGARPGLQSPSGYPSSSAVTFHSAMPTVSPDVQRRLRPPDLGPKTTEYQQTPGTPPKDVEKKMLEKPPPLAGPNVMNVVVVAAECAPWSKTGGLGDVVGALPKALARRGHRVMAVSPRYSNYAEAWETGVRRVYNVAGQDMEVGYFHAYIDGVDFVFIDSPIFHAWAHDIYGGSREDVLARMILFCKAAVEVPWHVPCGGACYGDGNLVFIANDWHTALLPVYLQAFYRDNQLMQYTRSVLVVHNIAHQGRGPLDDFRKLGLPDHYRDKFSLYDPIGGEHMNIFMAGLITCHRVIAVSHGYAWECQTQEGGWGLDCIIRDHSWKLKGVVNGIDDKEWNPELDPCLKTDGYTNFNIDTLATGKAACKAALQKELGLPVRADVPLLGFIGRLDYQKGVDIIAEAMPWMMSQDLQLVMLGTGRPDLEDMLRSFESQHRDKARGWVGFSVVTAHRITAGVDILLMPSRFEPCGLNQLYAMRYGTVPVVHAVGGLRDTVKPFDPFSEQGLGWTFDRAEAAGLIHAIGNALWTYRDFKGSWRGIQKRGMSQDLSWDNAAQQYEEVLIGAKYQW